MTTTKSKAAPVERKAYRVDEFKDAYRISNATVYKLIKSGKLKSILVGGRRLIPVEAVAEWLAASRA